ncbi:hypothetical protein CYMTET_13389 [Cymbomonas tetramitiformis]|uniref:Uncharacterized protein n=1 Tax=Cymbomonas tetramitiformis TaxID=36881 RepID=A0AAE0GIJ6_9CHLO|nr:hypothetical protein CYMTET_13389 [Cymbomonas tetramitiformis]
MAPISKADAKDHVKLGRIVIYLRMTQFENVLLQDDGRARIDWRDFPLDGAGRHGSAAYCCPVDGADPDPDPAFTRILSAGWHHREARVLDGMAATAGLSFQHFFVDNDAVARRRLVVSSSTASTNDGTTDVGTVESDVGASTGVPGRPALVRPPK